MNPQQKSGPSLLQGQSADVDLFSIEKNGLEHPGEAPRPTVAPPTPGQLTPKHPRRKALATAVATGWIVIIAGIGIFTGVHHIANRSQNEKVEDRFTTSSLAVELPNADLLHGGALAKLQVNGQLEVGDSLVLQPIAQPSKATAGQIYFDNNTNTPFIFDGTQFTDLRGVASINGVNGSLELGGGLVLNGSVIGVTSAVAQAAEAITATGIDADLLTSGVISVARGGTGLSEFNANGIVYGGGSGVLQITGSLSNAVLTTSSQGVPQLTQSLPVVVQQNITTTGVLAAGAIATGFGSIDTDSLIATSNRVRIGGSGQPVYALDVQGTDLIAARFSGRVIGDPAVNSNEFTTLGQVTTLIATGSGNPDYIQNQTTTAQAADFRISGNGTVRSLALTVGTGTAPLIVSSTTVVANLNADLLDGQSGNFYQNAGNLISGTLSDARLSAAVAIDRGTIADGTDFNMLTDQGSYRAQTVNWSGYANAPGSAYSYGVLVVSKTNTSVVQSYYPHNSNASRGGVWVRSKYNANDWGAWDRMFTSATDGAGSGSDADLLDGLHASAFAAASGSNSYIQNGTNPQSASFNVSGTATVGGLATFTGGLVSSGSDFNLSGNGAVDSTAPRVYSANGYLFLQYGSGGVTYFRNASGDTIAYVSGNGNLRLSGVATINGTGVNTLAGSLQVNGNINTDGSLATAGIARISNTGNLLNIGTIAASGSITTAGQFVSTVANGTAPLSVSSSTQVANLNADMLDGLDAEDFKTINRPTYLSDTTDWNTVTGRGYYRLSGNNGTNTPVSGAWNWSLVVNSSITSYHLSQYATQHRNGANEQFVRHGYASSPNVYTWTSWARIWHSQNGGAGSGLDADLLDGQDSSAFAAASGSVNYIQNQNDVPQNAQFNITGEAISGGVAIYNPANGTATAQFQFDSTNTARIRIGGAGDGANRGLHIQGVGDVSLLRILGSGNIGIGTVTPGARLDVNGDAIVRQGFTAGGGRFVVNDQGRLTVATTYGGAQAYFKQAGSTYAHSDAVIVADTDNPNGLQNYLYQGRLDGVNVFSVRANGDISGRDVFAANATASGDIFATTFYQSGNAVCDTTNNCGFATGSGDADYIQNRTTPQVANFNVTGYGTIGANLNVSGHATIDGLKAKASDAGDLSTTRVLFSSTDDYGQCATGSNCLTYSFAASAAQIASADSVIYEAAIDDPEGGLSVRINGTEICRPNRASSNLADNLRGLYRCVIPKNLLVDGVNSLEHYSMSSDGWAIRNETIYLSTGFAVEGAPSRYLYNYSGAYVALDDGSLGVGTAAPVEKLDVRGSIYATGNLRFANGLGQRINLFDTGGPVYGIGVQTDSLYFRSDTDFNFYRDGSHSDARGNAGSGGVSLLTIKDTGNVGIGTSAPTYRLAVNGSANATSVYQNGNQVCDNTNNCNYAAASGSGNYIHNGTNPQSASFNVTGAGTVGGLLSVLTQLAVENYDPTIYANKLAFTPQSFDQVTVHNRSATSNFASIYLRSIGASGNAAGRIVLQNHSAGQSSFAFQLRSNGDTANTTEVLRITDNGNVTAIGRVTAASLQGDGAYITNINAGSIASGTLSNSRLSGTTYIARGAVSDDFNNYIDTGAYRVSAFVNSSVANGPSGAYQWGMLRVERYDTTNYVTQTYIPDQGNTGIWTRNMWAGSWRAWHQTFTSANDGSGSGLDADLLDGLDSSAFAAASGSNNYIQNGTNPQAANFNISGNGSIGGQLTVGGGVRSAQSTLSVTSYGVTAEKPTTNLLYLAGSNQLPGSNLSSGIMTVTSLGDGKYRVVNSSSSSGGTIRIYVHLSHLTNGQNYAVGYSYENLTGSIGADWSDAPLQNYVNPGGSAGRITGYASRAQYDSTYRFLDVQVGANTTVDIFDAQVEEGTVSTSFVPGTRAVGDVVSRGRLQAYGNGASYLGGKLSVGGTFAAPGLLSNTATNTTDINGYGVTLGQALTWRTDGAGYVQSLSNVSTSSNANGLLINTAATGSTIRALQVQSGDVTRLFVRGDGRVGIGTDTPGALLDVAGATEVERLTVQAGASNSLTSVTIQANSGSTGGWNRPYYDLLEADGGGVRTRLFGDGGNLYSVGSVNVASPMTYYAINTDGYFGLNTTTPGARFTVQQSSVGSSDGLWVQDPDGRKIAIYGTGAGGEQRLETIGTSNPFAIRLNSSEVARFTAYGRLGLGSNAPNKKLTLDTADNNDGIRINGSGAQNNPALMLTSTDTNAGYRLAYNDVNDNLLFDRTNGSGDFVSTLMTLNSSGNLGIGVANPIHRLQVNGDGVFGKVAATNLSLTDNFSDLVNNSTWYGSGIATATIASESTNIVQYAGFFGMLFRTDQGSAVLTRYGNFGIGTQTPGQRLDVQGGNINTSGALMTGGITRIDNVGNISNIANITASGDLTVGGYTYLRNGAVIGTKGFGSSDNGTSRWIKLATITHIGPYEHMHAEVVIQDRYRRSSLNIETASGGVYNSPNEQIFNLQNDYNNGYGQGDIKIGRLDTGSTMIYDIWVRSGTWSSSSYAVYHHEARSMPDMAFYSGVYDTSADPTATGYDAQITPSTTKTTTGGLVVNGTTVVNGSLRATEEIVGNAVNHNQFRAVSDTYGTIFRQDGTNFHLLTTANGDPFGGWSSHRPLIVNNSTGSVQLANATLTATVAGNVGIGTTTPGRKLDVQGDVRIYTDLHFDSLSRQKINLYTDDYGIGIQTATTYFRTGGDFHFYRGGIHTDTQGSPGGGGTSQLAIKQNGNLGVGTATPGAKIQIGTTTQFNISVNESVIDENRYYMIGSYNDNNGEILVDGILSGHDDAQGKANVNIKFSHRGGFIYTGTAFGNVGTAASLEAYRNGTVTYVYLKTHNYGLTNLTVRAVSGAQVRYDGTYATAIPSGTKVFDLRTDAGNVLRMSNSGNLGLGTVAPAEKLEVVGSNVTGLIRATSGNANLRAQSSNGNYLLLIGNTSNHQVIQASTGSDIRIRNATDGTLLTLTGSTGSSGVGGGKVGIGTETPATALDILSTSTQADVLTVGSSVAASRIVFNNANISYGDVRIGAESSGQLVFSTGATSRIVIRQNGNVGIGTTTAAAKFVVQDNPNENSQIRMGQGANAADTQIEFRRWTGVSSEFASSQLIQTNYGFGINTTSAVDGTNMSRAFTILRNGNVGIGTESPTTKLDVVGDLKVSGRISSHNSRTQYYSSIAGNSGDWYNLFQMDDGGNGVVTVNLKSYAHRSISFVVTKGYAGNGTINILNAQTSNNGGYATVSGVRILDNGLVQARFSWSSGPTVNVSMQVAGTHSTPEPTSSLAASSSTATVIDSVTDEITNGVLRASGNLIARGSLGLGTAIPATKLDVVGGVAIGGGVSDLYAARFATNPGARNAIRLDNLSPGSGRSNMIDFADNGVASWSLGNDRINNGSQDFFIFDSVAAQHRFFIQGNGNVGIGTTSPSDRLTVEGSGRFTGSVSVIGDVFISGSDIGMGNDSSVISFLDSNAENFTDLWSNKDGLSIRGDSNNENSVVLRSGNLYINQNARIQDILSVGSKLCVGATTCTNTLGVNGSIAALDSITANSTPDIAEYIPAATDVVAADVVMADPNNPERVVKATHDRKTTALGVISDGTSSFLINPYGNVEGKPARKDIKPLVLAGRVPVKVTNENGAITPGDLLTISKTKPGYAAKATTPGPTIGTALAFANTSDGTVLALIQKGYHNPTDSDRIQAQSLSLTHSATIGQDLNVMGRTTLKQLTVTGSVAIQQDLTVTGNIRTTDITIAGHIITAGERPVIELPQEADELATITLEGNDSAGAITFTTGDEIWEGNMFTVRFTKQYGNVPRVILNASNEHAALSGQYKSAADAESFTITFANKPTANTTYSFDYFVVE